MELERACAGQRAAASTRPGLLCQPGLPGPMNLKASQPGPAGPTLPHAAVHGLPTHVEDVSVAAWELQVWGSHRKVACAGVCVSVPGHRPGSGGPLPFPLSPVATAVGEAWSLQGRGGATEATRLF